MSMSFLPFVLVSLRLCAICSVFVLDTDPILPVAMMSLIRLLLLTQEEWEKAREKGRPPKAKFDLQVSELLRRIFEIRLSTYQSSDLGVCYPVIFLQFKNGRYYPI